MLCHSSSWMGGARASKHGKGDSKLGTCRCCKCILPRSPRIRPPYFCCPLLSCSALTCLHHRSTSWIHLAVTRNSIKVGSNWSQIFPSETCPQQPTRIPATTKHTCRKLEMRRNATQAADSKVVPVGYDSCEEPAAREVVPHGNKVATTVCLGRNFASVACCFAHPRGASRLCRFLVRFALPLVRHIAPKNAPKVAPRATPLVPVLTPKCCTQRSHAWACQIQSRICRQSTMADPDLHRPSARCCCSLASVPHRSQSLRRPPP